MISVGRKNKSMGLLKLFYSYIYKGFDMAKLVKTQVGLSNIVPKYVELILSTFLFISLDS